MDPCSEGGGIVNKYYPRPIPEPVDEMCDGCARNQTDKCEIILDPTYIYDERNGKCFAKMDAQRAAMIEREIKIGNRKQRSV